MTDAASFPGFTYAVAVEIPGELPLGRATRLKNRQDGGLRGPMEVGPLLWPHCPGELEETELCACMSSVLTMFTGLDCRNPNPHCESDTPRQDRESTQDETLAATRI
ncbi:unnamed protein product [Pleuronectes platessa]|uniref:Uncharacterized protein n=1 Tax=Pleuronectes platessa TaxID=8262 RepID=A0A9N7U8N0_PLEPL|nr:unnamed protein product [Pleuronectes platessa]